MTAHPTMLVASDLSKKSALALKRAVALTDELGALLELLHVVRETLLDYFLPQKQTDHSITELIEGPV